VEADEVARRGRFDASFPSSFSSQFSSTTFKGMSLISLNASRTIESRRRFISLSSLMFSSSLAC
jgi:hypothetical protein